MTVFRRLAAAPVVALALAVVASAPAAAQDNTVTIMAFGDSLVHGYGLPEGEPFPAQLEAALKDEGYDVEVINAGSSGDTSKSGRSRLSWVLQDRVDAAIVVLGANDALRGIDPAVTRENLDAVLQTLDDKGVATLLAGMKAPRNMGEQYVQEFDSVFPDLAEKHGTVFYPFFLKGVAQQPDLNQSDGIHPNAKGVRVIVDNILPKVEQLIERVRSNAAS
jgi:acyl-CoA thioesterase-1